MSTQTIPADAQRIAAIDVGSNTIKMLAVQRTPAGFSVLKWHSITVRLQSGLMPDGSLDEAALQRAEVAICTLAEMARAEGAQRIRAFGTSALRDAANAGELVRRVKQSAQVDLTVISGEQEAASAYAAAAPTGEVLVVNPGGGSTEMIVGRDGKPLCAVSAHIGAVSLMAIAQNAAPDRLIALAKERLAPEFARLPQPLPAKVIASGGAAACAADVLIALPKHDSAAVEGYVLHMNAALSLLHRLCGMTIEQRCAMPGMNPGRADILPCGLALLIGFMQLAGRDSLSISDRGNLYGFIEMI